MTAVIILYKYRSAMLQAKYSKKAPTGVFFWWENVEALSHQALELTLC